jgi:aspartate kinase
MFVPVMKFGGTSVGDGAAIRRVVEIVRSEIARGSAPVVVVSAMSGVTDRLLTLAREAAAGDRESVQKGLDELSARHLDTVRQLLTPSRKEVLDAAIRAQFEELRSVLTALAILREASPRSLDGIAAVGELLSSRAVAAALEEAGVRAAWIDARRVIVTDDTYMSAAPLFEQTRDATAREVIPILEAGVVPVLGGYIGATEGGITTTLGRGGSDYSASMIGAALHDAARRTSHDARSTSHAARSTSHDARSTSHVARSTWQLATHIWTDVDGMLTADPRVIDSPRVVPQISFGEASELAYFGAKVLHPSTILPAVERDIPVRILNSRRPEAPGTLITADPVPSGQALAAIACKRRITVIEVISTRMLMAHGFLRRLFEVFERHRTAVDVVTTSEVSVSVTVDDDRQLQHIVRELQEFSDVVVEPDMALLCAVGDNLRIDPRLAVRLLTSLEGFPLRMVSQAASRRNLTVVLHESDLPGAMARLHQVWLAEPEAVAEKA